MEGAELLLIGGLIGLYGEVTNAHVHVYVHNITIKKGKGTYCSVPDRRLINTPRDFGPHGHLPGIKILYVCIEAATVTPGNAVNGCLPESGHLPWTLR